MRVSLLSFLRVKISLVFDIIVSLNPGPPIYPRPAFPYSVSLLLTVSSSLLLLKLNFIFSKLRSTLPSSIFSVESADPHCYSSFPHNTFSFNLNNRRRRFSFSMADSSLSSFTLFLLLLHITVSAISPQISPSPSSDSPASSPSPLSPSPSIHAPNPAPASSPLGSSPPAPSPSPSPSPSPADGSTVSHTGVSDDEGKADRSSGGMSAGKKVGVAFGVIVAAGVIVMGAMIYKKRQQNIRRAQYAQATRREIL